MKKLNRWNAFGRLRAVVESKMGVKRVMTRDGETCVLNMVLRDAEVS